MTNTNTNNSNIYKQLEQLKKGSPVIFNGDVKSVQEQIEKGLPVIFVDRTADMNPDDHPVKEYLEFNNKLKRNKYSYIIDGEVFDHEAFFDELNKRALRNDPNPLDLPMTLEELKHELEWMIDGLQVEAQRLLDDRFELLGIVSRDIKSPTVYNDLMMMVGEIELKLEKLDEDIMELEMQLSDII